MSKHRIRRAFGMALAAGLLALGMSPPVRALERLPDRLYMKAGEAAEFSFALPGSVELEQDAARKVISSFDQRLEDIGQQVALTAGDSAGEAYLTFRLLGLVPLKTVQVSVGREKTLVPGGHSVGVALLTEGVVVVGASDLGSVPSPARLAGLRSGDRIVALNGVAVENANQLAGLVDDGKPCLCEIVRGEKKLPLEITPARDPRDGAYRLGAWVRDSTAGIGTLSFFDPDTGSFGALGHAIEDVDTGIMLPVGMGGIYESSVVEVSKGRQGSPGELLGQFFNADKQLGVITENTPCGIFGTADAPFVNPLYPEGVPVSTRGEVHVGPAQLLTTLTSGEIAAYDCEIVKLNLEDDLAARSLVLQITDPELLAETGGIVQGMSGSPIIQDGKLAGAVTHVLVNDPTRGYGIFLENMLAAEAAG